MAGLNRIHTVDHPMQEHPPKKVCSQDDSIHGDLVLTHADLLLTAVPEAGSHNTMETGADITLHAAKPPNLDHLPNGVLTHIFIHSHEPNLIHVCRNTLYVLPSYVWYSSSLAMLALLGTASMGRSKDRGPQEIPSNISRSLQQVIGPKFTTFFDGTNRADLKHSVLTSKCFSAAQYEVIYMRLARTVMSAAFRYLYFDWKQSHIDSIRQQFARTKNMKALQTLCFNNPISDGQGLPPRPR